MKHILFSAVIASALFGCNTNKTPEPANIPLGVHRAVVEEVLQTSQYQHQQSHTSCLPQWRQ